MSEPVSVSVEDFRRIFPQFSDTEKYPDSMIESYLAQALAFVSDRDGCILQLGEARRKMAILYAAAHLLSLYMISTNGGITFGGTGGLIGSTSVGSVSVSMIPPPNSKEYYWYWNQTPYGQTFLNIARVRIPCGLFFGGSDQRRFPGNNK